MRGYFVMNSKFEELVCSASKYHESADCAVKAVASVCDIPYEVAHKALKDAGRKDNHGTKPSIYKKVIESFGYDVFTLRDSGAKTCVSAEKVLKNGKYLCRVTKHVFAVIDGEIIDNGYGRRKHFIEVLKVVKKGSRGLFYFRSGTDKFESNSKTLDEAIEEAKELRKKICSFRVEIIDSETDHKIGFIFNDLKETKYYSAGSHS